MEKRADEKMISQLGSKLPVLIFIPALCLTHLLLFLLIVSRADDINCSIYHHLARLHSLWNFNLVCYLFLIKFNRI